MITSVLLILFTIILLSLFRQLWKFRNLRDISGPQGLQSLVLINELRNKTKTLFVLSKIAKNYGPVTKLMVHPWDLWLLITDHEMTEFFLQSLKFVQKAQTYTYLHPWIGNGTLTSEGKKWQKYRKFITPLFYVKLLEEYLAVYSSASDVFVECLLKEVDKESCDVYPYVAAYAMDIITETAFGMSINAQKKSANDYLNAVHVMSRIVIKRTFTPWMRKEFLFKLSDDYIEQEKAVKILNDTVDTIVQQRKRLLLENMNDSNCKSSDSKEENKSLYIDIFLKCTLDGKVLDDALIRNFVNEAILAGYDTAASAVSFMIYALANNVDVQNKVVEELKSIYGNDKNRHVTAQDINDMKYMELVIKEVLRLYPPVPFIARTTTEDIEYKGAVLPKGLLLLFNIYGMHRSPKLFDDPDTFNPDRFLSPGAIKPYSFIPFSAGPRNCLGQKYAMNEMKVTFAKLLRHFEFLSAGPEFKPQLVPELVLKSENGVRVRIQRREF